MKSMSTAYTAVGVPANFHTDIPFTTDESFPALVHDTIVTFPLSQFAAACSAVKTLGAAVLTAGGLSCMFLSPANVFDPVGSIKQTSLSLQEGAVVLTEPASCIMPSRSVVPLHSIQSISVNHQSRTVFESCFGLRRLQIVYARDVPEMPSAGQSICLACCGGHMPGVLSIGLLADPEAAVEAIQIAAWASKCKQILPPHLEAQLMQRDSCPGTQALLNQLIELKRMLGQGLLKPQEEEELRNKLITGDLALCLLDARKLMVPNSHTSPHMGQDNHSLMSLERFRKALDMQSSFDFPNTAIKYLGAFVLGVVTVAETYAFNTPLVAIVGPFLMVRALSGSNVKTAKF
ncbi:hypothetical protein CEUSTIGMA_g13735.t1 [Chlamydomonas eustigma]|uniref:Uncharacterized protein n=1 Tax=Chlamydomonas eustigma TaxID=1157962 RepID=A0A250XTI7_9CHLO|nr:hypothetical protein CEUSTIGMA_g13735.t1 [Chlamydomonas eustigma]|eukprot:GAX86323.1 hypothetical protein CEUSTIGMA_g13735.t1 [Chlamydomonas eustigma]